MSSRTPPQLGLRQVATNDMLAQSLSVISFKNKTQSGAASNRTWVVMGSNHYDFMGIKGRSSIVTWARDTAQPRNARDTRPPGQQSRPVLRPKFLDSSSGNQRQEDSKNREAWVRRPADRRSVEWLGRRGGRRLRACWRVGDGGRGGDGSGCWRAGRRAVCGRTKRAARPEPLWG